MDDKWELLDAREKAEIMVNGFENTTNIYTHLRDSESWQKLLSTAREWLRLINKIDVIDSELYALLNIVHANGLSGSSWFSELAYCVYNWVGTKGISVPPPNIFFARNDLPHFTEFYKSTSKDRAQKLLAIFEQYHQEDPTYEAWSLGKTIVHAWLRIMENKEMKQTEVSDLIVHMSEGVRRFGCRTWLVTGYGICYWCNEIGLSELIPDNFCGVFKPVS